MIQIKKFARRLTAAFAVVGVCAVFSSLTGCESKPVKAIPPSNNVEVPPKSAFGSLGAGTKTNSENTAATAKKKK